MIEIISAISRLDSPIHEWQCLSMFLITNLTSDDMQIVNIALEIANSLFKPYRSEFSPHGLIEEITFVAGKLTQPLTVGLMSIMFALKTHQHDDVTLHNTYKAVILTVKVLHSLISHDLPQCIQDNLGTWMNAFHEMMCFGNTAMQPNVCYLQIYLNKCLLFDLSLTICYELNLIFSL